MKKLLSCLPDTQKKLCSGNQLNYFFCYQQFHLNQMNTGWFLFVFWFLFFLGYFNCRFVKETANFRSRQYIILQILAVSQYVKACSKPLLQARIFSGFLFTVYRGIQPLSSVKYLFKILSRIFYYLTTATNVRKVF